MTTFKDIARAILQKDLNQISKYLTENPLLILEKDTFGNYISHYAVTTNDINIINKIYTFVYQQNKTDLFFIPNTFGDTPLHFSASYNNVITLSFLKLLLNKEKMQNAAKKINNQDFLHIHLVDKNPHIDDHPRLRNIFESLLLVTDMRNLNDLIYPQDILKTYPESKNNKRLKENIMLACRIINHTRLKINASSTHPQNNHFEKKHYDKISSQIKNMRDSWNTKEKALLQEFKEEKVKSEKILEEKFQHMNKFRVGNCEEYSFYGLRVFRLFNQTTPCEIYKLINGDHAFLVIDRNPKTKPNDFHTWNDTVIICDPWSGDVFLAKEIFEKLKDYYRHNNKNITAPLNPAVHSVAMLFSYKPQSESKLEFKDKIELASKTLLKPIQKKQRGQI